MTSVSSAASPLSSFLATRSTKSSMTGMCTEGGVPEAGCAAGRRPSTARSTCRSSACTARRTSARTSGAGRRSRAPRPGARPVPSPRRPSGASARRAGGRSRGRRTRRFRLPSTVGSMLVTGSGHTPEVIETDPGVMWIFSGSRCHSPCGRVTARSCSEFVRARCPSWLERPVSRPSCCM